MAQTEEEQYLYRMIRELHASYLAAAKPFHDRLVEIQSLKIEASDWRWTVIGKDMDGDDEYGWVKKAVKDSV